MRSVTGRKLDVKIPPFNPALHGTHDWIWITSVLQPASSFRNRIYGDVLQHQDLEKYWIKVEDGMMPSEPDSCTDLRQNNFMYSL